MITSFLNNRKFNSYIMTQFPWEINGNTAEILVSFTDDGTGDYIHGEVDMYDSYHLKSYSGESNVGGCYFMEYDETQDKAYFQIDLTSTEGTFDTERMEFNVYQLLTDCQSFTEEISLENMDTSYDLKAVSLNGRSGMGQENPLLNRLSWSGDEADPRPGHLVMNVPVGEMDPEKMELTAVSYEEGILKVQLFRGNFKAADRHMNIYLLDEAGNLTGSTYTFPAGTEFTFIRTDCKTYEDAKTGDGRYCRLYIDWPSEEEDEYYYYHPTVNGLDAETCFGPLHII